MAIDLDIEGIVLVRIHGIDLSHLLEHCSLDSELLDFSDYLSILKCLISVIQQAVLV